jgi:hypothetical protein
MADLPPKLLCARCDREVVDARESYEVFERMHYVCFHFEFEHDTDPDIGCEAMGCPSSELGGPWSHPTFPITPAGRARWREKVGDEYAE